LNVAVPTALAVPLSTPVGERVKPGGNAPWLTDQMYEPVPPAPPRDSE
jgi:hypothetical protein